MSTSDSSVTYEHSFYMDDVMSELRKNFEISRDESLEEIIEKKDSSETSEEKKECKEEKKDSEEKKNSDPGIFINYIMNNLQKAISATPKENTIGALNMAHNFVNQLAENSSNENLKKAQEILSQIKANYDPETLHQQLGINTSSEKKDCNSPCENCKKKKEDSEPSCEKDSLIFTVKWNDFLDYPKENNCDSSCKKEKTSSEMKTDLLRLPEVEECIALLGIEAVEEYLDYLLSKNLGFSSFKSSSLKSLIQRLKENPSLCFNFTLWKGAVAANKYYYLHCPHYGESFSEMVDSFRSLLKQPSFDEDQITFKSNLQNCLFNTLNSREQTLLRRRWTQYRDESYLSPVQRHRALTVAMSYYQSNSALTPVEYLQDLPDEFTKEIMDDLCYLINPF